MVRLRCEKCKNDAAVVSLVGYNATYLCEHCETRRVNTIGTSIPTRRLANLVKPDNTQGDQLVCGVCKVAPARVFSPKSSQVYCWRCNEHEEKEGNTSPRFLVFGIQLKSATNTESELSYDPHLFTQSWNFDSDVDSMLIESPKGLAPAISVSSNLISQASGELKSGDTSKSHYTNENLGGVSQECGTESDVLDDVMPEGVVEGFPCGTIPVSELPGYKRSKRGRGVNQDKNRKISKTGRNENGTSTQRRCMRCGVLKTPQWRAGPSGQKTLCNACGVKAARGAASGKGRGRGRKSSNPSPDNHQPVTN
eukprot:g273.t1